MGRPSTTRRKLAIASWGRPRDPSIHGRLTVDAAEALACVERLRETTGEHVTLTHLVGRAVAEALVAEPSVNGRIRLGRFVPHDDVTLSFLVQVDEGAELASARVPGVEDLSVAGIAAEVRERAGRLRDGRDPDWERSRDVVRLLPTWLLSPLLWLVGWLGSSLGVALPALGVRRFPFGSAIVTNVGMLGLDEAYIPPTPFARVPLYVLVGAVRQRPAVVDGEVRPRPQLTITATLDHRFVDGVQAGTLASTFRRVMEDPWSLEDMPARPADAAPAVGGRS